MNKNCSYDAQVVYLIFLFMIYYINNILYTSSSTCFEECYTNIQTTSKATITVGPN